MNTGTFADTVCLTPHTLQFIDKFREELRKRTTLRTVHEDKEYSR